MKKISRVMSIILSIVLISALFVGCGSSGNGTSSSSSTGSSSSAASGSSNSGSGSSQAGAGSNIKVALVLSGSISDGSWNGGAYNGLKWLQENRKNIETTYVENVAVDDSKVVIQNLIDEKYNVIIAFASELSDVVNELAKENKDVYFIDTNTHGKNRPANVTALNGNQGEGAFLVGVIAASLSKSGKIGSVEGFDFGDLSDNYKNFVAGAEYINPNIKSSVSYVGSWTDSEKAKQTALAQISSGVDFIYASGDLIGTGVIAGCQEKNIPVIGYGEDLNSLAPKQVITTVNWNSGISFATIIDKIANGTFESTVYNASLKDGSIFLADYHGLLDEKTQKLVEEVKQGIIDGKIKTK